MRQDAQATWRRPDRRRFAQAEQVRNLAGIFRHIDAASLCPLANAAEGVDRPLAGHQSEVRMLVEQAPEIAHRTQRLVRVGMRIDRADVQAESVRDEFDAPAIEVEAIPHFDVLPPEAGVRIGRIRKERIEKLAPERASLDAEVARDAVQETGPVDPVLQLGMLQRTPWLRLEFGQDVGRTAWPSLDVERSDRHFAIAERMRIHVASKKVTVDHAVRIDDHDQVAGGGGDAQVT